jgi:oligopeptide/dipeptide ABC transporter ATP-binding protein
VLNGYAHQLSGGMAQRVVIALANLHGPRLLLADEPTTALDVTVQRQILDLMSGIATQGERSMVLVTHDLGVVAQYCQRVMVMYAGKPVEVGTVSQVFGQPQHHYTRALLNAVPRPGSPLAGLRGTLPDLVNYPVGCPYAPRCPAAQQVCATTAPRLEVSDPSRAAAACHFPLTRKEVGHVAASR